MGTQAMRLGPWPHPHVTMVLYMRNIETSQIDVHVPKVAEHEGNQQRAPSTVVTDITPSCGGGVRSSRLPDLKKMQTSPAVFE